MQTDGTNWTAVDQNRINQILADKAYIDMPNLDFLASLNPRQIYYGLKISIDL
jgi:hypothetical protein